MTYKERDNGTCWAEVDLDALRSNYRLARRLLPADAPVFAVVKADAYGHGADEVSRVLIEEGAYRYPYLGITSDNRFTVAELVDPLGLPVDRGVLVAEVTPGTAAAQAGLRGGDREVEFKGMTVRAGGDIIVKVDDYELRGFDDLIAYLVRETAVGQQVVLTVVREGEEFEISVTLGERP